MAILVPNKHNPTEGERNILNKKMLLAYLFFFIGIPFLFLEFFLLSHLASPYISIHKLLYSPLLLSTINKSVIFPLLIIGFAYYSFLAYHLTDSHFPYDNKAATRILAWSSFTFFLLIFSGGIVNIINSILIFCLSNFLLGMGYFSYILIKKKMLFFGVLMTIFFLSVMVIFIDALKIAETIQWPIIAVSMIVNMIISIKKMGSQKFEHDKDLYYRYTGRRIKENTD